MVSSSTGKGLVKVAVTVWKVLTRTIHVPVPVQPFAFHPVNVEPLVGVAVKITVVPMVKFAVQLLVHWAMPPGELLTVPLPDPMLVTVRDTVLGGVVNVAETVCGAFITTTQEPIPIQAPDQPVNVEPAVPLAVRVTELSFAKSALHAGPQLIPGGSLVTRPSPVFVTDSSRGGDGAGDCFDSGGMDESSEPAQANNNKNRTHVVDLRRYICCPCRIQLTNDTLLRFLAGLGDLLYWGEPLHASRTVQNSARN